MTAVIFGYLILISLDFNGFLFSLFSSVLISIEKVYQTCTVKTVTDHVRTFNCTLFSALGNVVFVFDILLTRLFIKTFTFINAVILPYIFRTFNLFHLSHRGFCVARSLWPESQSWYC